MPSVLSLSITGAGIQIDSVTSYNMDNISAAQRELFESMGKSSKTIEMFPEDTLAFITSQRLDLAYDVAIETMRDISQETSDSIDDALQSVREETGIDLEDDLFHRLDGEFTLGIFPSSQGILAKEANVDLGFALLAESSDTGALANTMDIFASKAGRGRMQVSSALNQVIWSCMNSSRSQVEISSSRAASRKIIWQLPPPARRLKTSSLARPRFRRARATVTPSALCQMA